MSIRTYAGRNKRKLSTGTEATAPSSTQALDFDEPTPRTAKRVRKVQVDVVSPLPEVSESTPSHATNSSSSSTNSPPNTPPKSPRKPLVRDLSEIFDQASPSRSPPKAIASRSSGTTPVPPSPSKVSKRMLGRSKTETSIGSSRTSSRTSSFAAIGLTKAASTASIGISPSKRSNILPTRPDPTPLPHSISESDLEPPPLARRTTKRTYAGASRSFLVAIPMNADGAFPGNSVRVDQEEDDQPRESYSNLRKRLGVDESSDGPDYDVGPPGPSRSNSNATSPSSSPTKGGRKGKQKAVVVPEPLPEGMMNPLKSITELRSKGEAQRFMDEAGYLLEGLGQESGVGLRRASALEIITKLCDPEFARRARLGDFIVRTWNLLADAGTEDQVLNVLAAFFGAVSAQDERQLLELSSGTTFAPHLLSLLCSDKPDPLALESLSRAGHAISDVQWKLAGIGRREKALISIIANTIRDKSGMFDDQQDKLSIALLASTALAPLAADSLPSDHITKFLATFKSTVQPLQTILSPSSQNGGPSADVNDESDLTELSDSSPPPLPSSAKGKLKARDEHYLPPNAPPIVLVHNLLRLLESFLSSSQPSSDDDEDRQDMSQTLDEARDEWLIETLVATAIFAELAEIRDDFRTVPSQCLDLTMRILVSLTHSRPMWCQHLLHNPAALTFIMRRIASCHRKRSHPEEDSKANIKLEGDEEEDGDGSEDADKGVLDRLCLALALLTNVVQLVDGSAARLIKLELDPACTLIRRECITKCTCANHTGALQVLVNLYEHQLSILSAGTTSASVKIEPSDSNPDTAAAKAKQVEEEADAAFLRGHLAVLFGLLLRTATPEDVDSILEGLPSAGSVTDDKTITASTPLMRSRKVAELAKQAKQFLSFFRIAMSGVLDGGAGEQRRTTTTLRGAGGEGLNDDEEIVMKVVGFLEGLARQ